MKKKHRSSKSALHGLIHWLSQWYCDKGITVNGVAPALITGTNMLPTDSEELKKSMFPPYSLGFVDGRFWRKDEVKRLADLYTYFRDSDGEAGNP